MGATWHTLPDWPHPRTEKPRASQFRTSWARSLTRAGGVAAALKAHHPDHGGQAHDFADVQAFRKSQAGGGR